jgi:hypothetical protein
LLLAASFNPTEKILDLAHEFFFCVKNSIWGREPAEASAAVKVAVDQPRPLQNISQLISFFLLGARQTRVPASAAVIFSDLADRFVIFNFN